MGDLARHRQLFRLDRDGLGASAVGVARNGVIEHFDHQVDADGNPWKPLSDKYREYKDRHWPGRPINVREGLMRSELVGETHVDARSADYVAGLSPEGRAEITYAEEGDPAHNRPARGFVGLNNGSIQASDQIFDNHFEEGV